MTGLLDRLKGLFHRTTDGIGDVIDDGIDIIDDGIDVINDTFDDLGDQLQAASDQFLADAGPDVFNAALGTIAQVHNAVADLLGDDGGVHDGDLPWELAHGHAMMSKDGTVIRHPSSADELDTIVLKNGNLLGARKWEMLDPGWAEALIQWMKHYFDRPDFVTNPALIEIDNNATIAIAGDWGTGPFETNAPSVLVGWQMAARNPDYTIHLGDTYYAGTTNEEDHNMVGWPQGSKGSFTLNSNHEMYSGAYGYFNLLKEFPAQNGTSYFALVNDHWLFIGLDSAYAADAQNLYMDGHLNDEQIMWLRTLPGDRRTVMLSHHQPYDITGKEQQQIYKEVSGALGKDPDYWYWGHLHNGIWYKDLNDSGFEGRCVGHGAIPVGEASMLRDCEDRVVWTETDSAGDPHYPERVLCGFIEVVLDGTEIRETMLGEDGSVRWTNQAS